MVVERALVKLVHDQKRGSIQEQQARALLVTLSSLKLHGLYDAPVDPNPSFDIETPVFHK